MPLLTMTRAVVRTRALLSLVFSGLLLSVSACSSAPIPKKFIRQAEPGVTLSALVKNPKAYHGKVVILGGVVVAQKLEGETIWLLVKNRPLDEDYVPHELISPRDSEAGRYWIMVQWQDFPRGFRTWARLTVVGRVSNDRPADHEPGPEPTIAALYLRGWGLHGREEVWEDSQDPNYIMSAPKPVTRN